MPRAITIIRDEHRALAAVLRGLQYVVADARESGTAPDFGLLHAMHNYIEAFPDRLHHPKEDDYVYRLLRLRTNEGTDVLNLLKEEHEAEAGWLKSLRAAIEACERDPAGAFEPLAAEVEVYVANHFEHMNKEEDIILPLAERVLTAEDWAEIDAAFADNGDPLVGVGTQKQFRELFRRIVNLMPAPHGLGPARK
ncbi:MAG: hemerythrin domain-containing protein [Hyphomicrobiales bacterium]